MSTDRTDEPVDEPSDLDAESGSADPGPSSTPPPDEGPSSPGPAVDDSFGDDAPSRGGSSPGPGPVETPDRGSSSPGVPPEPLEPPG